MLRWTAFFRLMLPHVRKLFRLRRDGKSFTNDEFRSTLFHILGSIVIELAGDSDEVLKTFGNWLKSDSNSAGFLRSMNSEDATTEAEVFAEYRLILDGDATVA